jgi:murein DD-endopeptidase MepM/ murein hydrolase activator NlpD
LLAPAWAGDWPITQLFGVNPSKYAAYNLAGHAGLDVGLESGTELYALADGEIIEACMDGHGYGWYLKLRTAAGEDWLYAHLLQSEQTKAGDRVIAGTPLGYSDNTGNSTGPHLHLAYRPWPELRGWPYDGWVDPRPFLLRLGAIE